MQEGVRFASSGDDDVKIWDSSSITVVDQFSPHESSHPVNSVCWGSNNNFLVTTSAVGDKIVISNYKGKPVPLFELAEGAKQTCISLSSNSMYIASGGIDSTVNIWDLKYRKLHRSLKDHRDEITCVSFNWNDYYIASGSMSGEIILHSIATNLSSTPFGHGSSQPIRHLKYSPFKKALLGSASDSGTVTLWDVNSQTPYHNFENSHKAPAYEICFSPISELLLVTVGLDKRIILYDTASKRQLRTLVAESPLTAVEFMPEGNSLIIGSSRGKIYHYDLRKLTAPVKSVSAHKTSVKCITLQNCNSFSKSSHKTSSSKQTCKKSGVKSTNNTGGIQNVGILKNLISNVPATFLPQSMPSNEVKGTDAIPDKSGLTQSSNLDVIPSKELDHGNTSNSTNFEDLGKNSLGDLFSPLRDDIAACKANEDVPGKNDGLDFQSYLLSMDFLSQFNNALPTRKNPAGSNPQIVHSSPLNIFVGSPIKEEDEHLDIDAKKTNHGKQESNEHIKQLSSSSSDSSTLNTPPVANLIKSPDSRERLIKNTQTQLLYESPMNGTTSTNPKISSNITSGVASTLSEKIIDTIGNSRSNAPLSSIQIHFIQNMIQETLDDFREACHRDIVNLQVEMIKQFHVQLNEMHALLERYSINDSLVAEIEKLREENKRLQTHF
ncbi:protein NEDD1 [Crotalus tigris]|uniref:protein NEDD1 n=1 Tax=Crotalus tigris TaxID=88082 RepID=UPI00192F89F7|nr:protein NEDD1 [Crotalus tigris]XP_039214091.1 protein NEDD1 [Crotalus tigris]XP_039214092.1 protein NEDD1 [Crotalus tigris]